MEFIVYLILAYLLMRAVVNLLRAMSRPQNAGPSRPGGGNARQQRENGSERATRLRDEEDIEDATWEDV